MRPDFVSETRDTLRLVVTQLLNVTAQVDLLNSAVRSFAPLAQVALCNEIEKDLGFLNESLARLASELTLE
jgi:hypothetical protein